MNKNIGDMTNSELKDFIIELQEENSRYERKLEKIEHIEKIKDLIEYYSEELVRLNEFLEILGEDNELR